MDRTKARGMDPHDRLDLAARKTKEMERRLGEQAERIERLEAQNRELLKAVKGLFEVQDQQDTSIAKLAERIEWIADKAINEAGPTFAQD